MASKRNFASFLQGDIKWTRHKERLEEAISEIEKAEVVSLDLEFSGLFTSGKKQKTVEEYYLHCAESVPRFLAVQLGLCTARREETDSDKWIFSPFNFHLFPSRRKVFMSDSLSLSWLLHQGFDLRRWVEDGYDYKGLGALQNDFGNPANERVADAGAQRLIEAVIELQKPIVVHNGMLDLLHTYEKFIDDLPPTLQDFCRSARELFSGGIYDTKRMAEEGRLNIFRLSDSSRGATSLDSLRWHLSQSRSSLKFIVNDDLAAMKAGEMDGYNLSAQQESTEEKRTPSEKRKLSEKKTPPLVEDGGTVGGTEDHLSPTDVEKPASICTDKTHEAGFDAMITLQIFFLELEWLRRGGETTPLVANGADSSVIPKDWNSFPFCQRTVNAIEVVGIPPGKLLINDEVRGKQEEGGNGGGASAVEAHKEFSRNHHQLMPPVLPFEIVGTENLMISDTAKRFAAASNNNNIVETSATTVMRAVIKPRRDPLRGTYRNLQAIFTHDEKGNAN